MNEEGEYILFLKKSEAGPVHTIVGMYQGKYDLNMPDLVNAKVNETDIETEYLGENVEATVTDEEFNLILDGS